MALSLDVALVGAIIGEEDGQNKDKAIWQADVARSQVGAESLQRRRRSW